jgi:hypothetical protein
LDFEAQFFLTKRRFMKIIKFVSSMLVSALLASPSFAGICEITIDRKACPGKEKTAFEPYANKGIGDVAGACVKCNPTVEKKPAKDEAECKTKTEEASKIQRKGTLSEKSATGKMDGKTFGPFTDKPGC